MLEKQADRNLIKFNKSKPRVLHSRQDKLTPQYTMDAVCLESNYAKKMWGPCGHQIEHEPT